MMEKKELTDEERMRMVVDLVIRKIYYDLAVCGYTGRGVESEMDFFCGNLEDDQIYNYLEVAMNKITKLNACYALLDNLDRFSDKVVEEAQHKEQSEEDKEVSFVTKCIEEALKEN